MRTTIGTPLRPVKKSNHMSRPDPDGARQVVDALCLYRLLKFTETRLQIIQVVVGPMLRRGVVTDDRLAVDAADRRADPVHRRCRRRGHAPRQGYRPRPLSPARHSTACAAVNARRRPAGYHSYPPPSRYRRPCRCQRVAMRRPAAHIRPRQRIAGLLARYPGHRARRS